MKLVTVVIKPFKLEDVREALSSIGIQGLTVRKVTRSSTAAPSIASTFCQK